MVRTSAADELCQYCSVSLEFFSNTNRYLHFLRHYRDKRQQAGYHHLDRSRLAERDVTVPGMKALEETVAAYKGESADRWRVTAGCVRSGVV